MPWTHVIAPATGLVTNLAPTALPPGASPNLSGVYLKQGQVVTDYGFVNFPTSSATQSNQLIGTVMAIKTFNLSSGIEYLCCFTTSFLYIWNTHTHTWDVYSQGVLLDNAEVAWTGSANVTTTRDTTIKIRDTYSSKNIIASAFTTGIVSYHNFVAVDISATTLTNLSFWFYSTVSLASDVIRVRISDQNAGGTGSHYADYTVPAITANTWTHVSVLLSAPVAGAFTAANYAAVLSVSLIAHTDPGVVTIYIDDIQAVQCFTGTEDNRFSLSVIYDTLIITNGIDIPSQLIDSGGAKHSTLTLSLPTGAVTASEVVRSFKDHVMFMNNTENGGEAPQRVTWSNIGTILDYVDGTSGFQDLTDNQDVIIGAEIFSENLMLIYKENSVVACSWVGGQTPFRFDPLIYGYGALSKDSILPVEGYHVVIDNGDVYVTNGSSTPQTIDASVQQQLFDRLNGNYILRTWTRFIKVDNEIEIYICYQDTTPDIAYVFNQVDTNWTIRSRNIMCAGDYQTQSFLTIGELIGTIAQQNYKIGSQTTKSFNPITLVGDVNGRVYQLSKQAVDNAGTAIVSVFDTPDFVVPGSNGTMFEDKNMRLSQLALEAMGTSITVQYSLDGGITWNACQGGGTNVITLTSTYQEYELFFETDAKRIRFRFSGGPFSLRYYGFNWMLRSGRR